MVGVSRGPYVGLPAFRSDESELFYGRSWEANRLNSYVWANRLVIVHGGSGVGKTSLIRAGFLPRLDRTVNADQLPFARPFWSLTGVNEPGDDGNPFTNMLLSAWEPDHVGSVGGPTVTQFLRDRDPGRDRYGDELPLLAVIDQFEELFHASPRLDPFRDEFLAQLAEAIDEVARLRLLVVVRDEAVGATLALEDRVSSPLHVRFRLRALPPAQALEAVVQPLSGTDRHFAQGAAEELVDQLRTTKITILDEDHTVVDDVVDPVNLQIVCSSLWRSLPSDTREITVVDVRKHADVQHILTEFCKDAVSTLAAEEDLDEDALWDWLVDTFITDSGTRGTAYEGAAFTAGKPTPVARRLVELRILRAEMRSGSVWFELLHDRLIEPLRQGHAVAQRLPTPPRPPLSAGEKALRRAETALADGSVRAAERHAARAIEASGDDRKIAAEAECFLGRIAFGQGVEQDRDRAAPFFAAAEDHYTRAAQLLDLDHDSRAVGQVLVTLGQLFGHRQLHAEAVHFLQSALTRFPPSAELQLEFARALDNSGQPRAALGQYQQVLAADPDESELVEALIGRAALEADLGDPEMALADLEHAIRLRPEAAERIDLIDARARARQRLDRRR